MLREKISLNNNWKFAHVWEDSMAEADYKEEGMETVRLPHTNVLLSYNYCNEEDYQELCGYRYHLHGDPSWKGREVTITFEGAAHEATLFVNGEKVAKHSCGYTAFTVDIASYLKLEEDNVIAVRLDSRESLNVPPFGKVIDYMTYGGLYREVSLEIHQEVGIDDLYITSGKAITKNPLLYFLMDVRGYDRMKDHTLAAEITLVPADTEYMKNRSTPAKEPKLQKNRILVKGEHCKVKIPVENVSLWDVKDPVLYDVKVVLLANGLAIDEKTVRMGFRDARFDADGFYLNGRKLRLRGMDRHQCFPYVGYAMPASMQRFDADVMKKKLGLNAVRTSHYPQSQHFLNHCDEIGLLVFTEMPGWQYIGDQEWKLQAYKNVEEMVLQYRQHPSIILWGVRINESPDDDEFYRQTNNIAHRLDPFRPTGGVRNFAKSHMFEDVYTYNDFVHNGMNQGVEPKSKITSDMSKGYLISEYNGHMFPTKAFDCEEHRLDHAMRHAQVLNDVAGYKDIAGSFGWCLADYNTHKDFGSGDRICYHGIMDMFRNPKLAADVYASQKPAKDGVVLSVASSMDIGEHPGGFLGPVNVFTNAEKVVLYKNNELIGEFSAQDTAYPNLAHGPIEIKDFIGNQLVDKEGYKGRKAQEIKKLLLDVSEYGLSNLPVSTKARMAKLMAFYGMKFQDGVDLFGKYIGNWGGYVTSYRFEAVQDGEVKKSVTREPMTSLHLEAICDHQTLTEGDTYDVAAVRFCAKDQNNNLLNFYQEPVVLELAGPGEIIGPKIVSLKGGMGGTYVKTTGEEGDLLLTIRGEGVEPVCIAFHVTKE